jgi:hypothetical protein
MNDGIYMKVEGTMEVKLYKIDPEKYEKCCNGKIGNNLELTITKGIIWDS